MSESQLKDGGVVREGRNLIDAFLNAEKGQSEAFSQANRANCEMKNATNALGKWLMPENSKNGETFCIWHEGHLLQAERVDQHTYKITVRQRAKL